MAEIRTTKIILEDKTDPNTEVHIYLESGELKQEKLVTTQTVTPLTSITEL